MDRKPYFPDRKRRAADIEAQIDAAAGTPSSKPAEKKAEKPAMSQADFSGYGKKRSSAPPKEMLERHQKAFSGGGKVRGGGCATRGFGKAMRGR